MKKILSLLITISILICALVGCNPNQPNGSLTLVAEANHDKVAEYLAAGTADVVILPEPKATVAINTAKANGFNYSIKLNLSTEWDRVSDTSLTMGCIVVNNSFKNSYEKSLADFLDEYESSIKFIGNPENKADSAQMIVNSGILPKLPIANSALTNLYGSIVYQDGDEMKSNLIGFFDAIEMQKPDASFYYSASSEPTGEAGRKIKIAVMNGPTGMGMAKLMNDENANNKYEFKMYSDPSIAATDLVNGDVDMACLPTNNAANLYNKSQSISVASINCLGSLYVVAKDEIQIKSISDLKDKTVYYGVPASTTAPIFKYIISKNKLEITENE